MNKNNNLSGCLYYGIVIAIFLFGAYMSYIGGSRFIKGMYYELYAEATEGEIIYYEESWDDEDKETYYTPVIEYNDAFNNTYKLQSVVSSNSKSFFNKRRILYMVGNPKKAIEGGFFKIWIYPILICLLGFICISVGYAIVKTVES